MQNINKFTILFDKSTFHQKVYVYLGYIKLCNMEVRDINRLKLVLVEKKRTAKWLAEELQKAPATVSKWCTNTSQPSLETLLEIAKLLEVDVKDLLHSSKQ